MDGRARRGFHRGCSITGLHIAEFISIERWLGISEQLAGSREGAVVDEIDVVDEITVVDGGTRPIDSQEPLFKQQGNERGHRRWRLRDMENVQQEKLIDFAPALG